MLQQDLIDLINSGDAIAFVGSGISTAAGLPTWPGLFDQVAATMEATTGQVFTSARKLAKEKRLLQGFDVLVRETSRHAVHGALREVIERAKGKSEHHARLADWPFRMYVTTNYDHLLEDSAPTQCALTPVGNFGAELQQLAGDARDIVWHAHGSSRMPEDSSQIILSDDDYQNTYPTSNIAGAIKSFAHLHRCVFVGFGFGDPDLVKVLAAAGRLAHAGRPSYAFVGFEQFPPPANELSKLRSDYNVVVIPYLVQNGSHSDLDRILQAHVPFILRKSQIAGGVTKRTPGYDPVSTSLRVQAALTLSELAASHSGLADRLIGARLMARLAECPGTSRADLIRGCQSHDSAVDVVTTAYAKLVLSKLLTDTDPPKPTDQHEQRCSLAKATVELGRKQFMNSLTARVTSSAGALPGDARLRIASCVGDFLESLCRQSGLGVAQNLVSLNPVETHLRAVALLKEFPNCLESLKSREEQLAAITLCRDVLTRASEAEAKYLGMACQSYFGLNIVGASDHSAKVDLEMIERSCYVLDASVLLCMLAPGSKSHAFTVKLVGDLVAAGAILATTEMLLDEVVEHANWALRIAGRASGGDVELLGVLRGLKGYKSNHFVEGYFGDVHRDSAFGAYVARVLGGLERGRATAAKTATILSLAGIQVMRLESWSGFTQDLFVERDRLQLEIASRRRNRRSYTHDRQVIAEAEVALVVDRIRGGQLAPTTATVSSAFFLTNTRVLDHLSQIAQNISIVPACLAQWLWSSSGVSSDRSRLVFDHLLWEIAQEGIEFIDKSMILRRFSGVVEASREELNVTIRGRSEFLHDKYGADPATAFAHADPLDLPDLLHEVNAAILVTIATRLKAAEKVAGLNAKERARLTRLEGKQKQKHKRAKGKQRAASGAKKR